MEKRTGRQRGQVRWLAYVCNRKKVFLITAFALKFRLLLLDEPEGGLDFQSTEYLYKQISGYKEHGTVLFSFHILKSITLTSDREINNSLKLAVLTGCLRTSKESIFTGFNNLKVLMIADERFDEYFGFFIN